ncbi:WXG100 family type VII secretion target [Arthrobacter psychrochitiniphilus]|uniref:WXG100 family type VII secretion target n=1 Tax=Arthrobacter psychrochitiniphilus TaxID=291045 RepID=UPI003F7C1916
MSGKMLGADPEQLRLFAKDMTAAGNNLRHTAMTLTHVISAAQWYGPDADNFRRTWSGHKRSIAQIVNGMNDASASLLRNAQEQENASSANSLGTHGSGGLPNTGPPNAGPTAAEVSAAAQELTDKLNAMTAQERISYLQGDDFKRWAAENSAAAKQAMDDAVAQGLILEKSPEYKSFLNDYWNNLAMERMGIDPSQWDTSKGTAHNWETIKKVYDFYGQQFLANPDLQWAGMANMIGPSFAGGFKDMDMVRTIAQEVLKGPIDKIPLDQLQWLRDVAAMPDDEVKFYEVAMLDMNKEIFLDQARQHMAYEHGGLTEIDRLNASGAISRETAQAWHDIDSGDPERIKHGNTVLLDREQNQIIKDDYDFMGQRPGTGEAVTYLVTLVGEPSIPGAKSFPEVFPYIFNVESPGPKDVPGTHWDNPLQFRTEVTTGLPDGNIAHQEQRWALITKDTLPQYQELLANDPARAREIISSDFNQRVEQSRPSHNIAPIVKRILDGFQVEVHQR